MAPRSNAASAQVEALRTLADELEAGTRELSPATAKALAGEVAREGDASVEEITPDAWEEAWADEIDARLASYRAGESKKVDVDAESRLHARTTAGYGLSAATHTSS